MRFKRPSYIYIYIYIYMRLESAATLLATIARGEGSIRITYVSIRRCKHACAYTGTRIPATIECCDATCGESVVRRYAVYITTQFTCFTSTKVQILTPATIERCDATCGESVVRALRAA